MFKRMALIALVIGEMLNAQSFAWITEKNFEKGLSAWLGQLGDELIQAWGSTH